MIDLDGFKAINDAGGHIVGDKALQDVARALQRSVRKFDICARYGGDEFAVLTPGSDATRAVQNAERIRRRIEAFHPAVVVPGTTGSVTISIGIAIGKPGMSSMAVIAQADRALYRAKADGGNCVRLAEP
jgi:diguanylate cyclase (GGDEF)-like protein